MFEWLPTYYSWDVSCYCRFKTFFQKYITSHFIPRVIFHYNIFFLYCVQFYLTFFFMFLVSFKIMKHKLCCMEYLKILNIHRINIFEWDIYRISHFLFKFSFETAKASPYSMRARPRRLPAPPSFGLMRFLIMLTINISEI